MTKETDLAKVLEIESRGIQSLAREYLTTQIYHAGLGNIVYVQDELSLEQVDFQWLIDYVKNCLKEGGHG